MKTTMKRTLVVSVSFCLVLFASVSIWHLSTHSKASNLLRENVEALSDSEGDMGVTTCLGIWGTCTLPDGTESKAPAVHVTL